MKPIKIKNINTIDFFDGPLVFIGESNKTQFLMYYMDDYNMFSSYYS